MTPDLIIQLDQAVTLEGSGAFRIMRTATDVQHGTNYDLGTSDVTLDGNILTLNNASLAANTGYYITAASIGAGDLVGTNGNALAGWFAKDYWSFTTGAAANSAPTNISLSASSINENNVVNAVIGNLSTIDANAGDSHTYSLVSGTGSTDNASFNISGNQLRASVVFDFESKNSYSIRVRTNDGQATFEKVFTITILDVADTDVTPPTVLSFSPLDDATNVPVNTTFVATFNENLMLQSGVSVVSLAIDGVNQTSYTSVSPELNLNGNVLTLNPSSDLLNDTNYNIYLGSGIKDLAGNSINSSLNTATSWNFTTAAATNSAPTDIALSASSINENNAINAVIGNLSTTDADSGDDHTYSLVSGSGSTDNASFDISGNQLMASVVFDFESKDSYSIRIR
ncbi:MAG: Ig-like domain-containing protein, partial [Coleofasciculus sp. C2-GNP5-27]